MTIEHNARGFYVDATQVETELAKEELFIVDAEGFNGAAQYVLERFPPRGEDPDVAHFYFADTTTIPWSISVEFRYSGYSNQLVRDCSPRIVEKELGVLAALWSLPEHTTELVYGRFRSQTPLAAFKKFLAKELALPDENFEVYIGPKAAAVALKENSDVFFINEGDLILIKTPSDK